MRGFQGDIEDESSQYNGRPDDMETPGDPAAGGLSRAAQYER